MTPPSHSSSAPEHFVVAIDGPAASGKSTVARELARRLGAGFVNSGSLYRAMTLAMLRAAVPVEEADAVAARVPESGVHSGLTDGISWVAIGSETVADALESASVNAAVSQVARVPEVRAEVVRQLRAFAAGSSIVMEGRDIGSVVFPDTPWKFYIDASEEVRQRRRSAQGQIDSIRDRDRADSSRKSAPLVVPEGAETIDSSDLTPAQVVDAVLASMRRRGFVFPAP